MGRNRYISLSRRAVTRLSELLDVSEHAHYSITVAGLAARPGLRGTYLVCGHEC